MSILDLGIIIFLIIGGLIGYKQGFTKSLVHLIGYLVIIIIAFIFKNPISEFMMLHLPFFDFYGTIKGLSVLNIAVYEVIAFLLVFGILLIILKILLLATTIFEKLLSLTIILGIPSKILGFILGVVKNYIIVFALLFILSLPNFADNSFIQNSKLKDPILENTPILSLFTGKIIDVFDEFAALKEKYETTNSSNKFNLETLDLFLKYDIITPDLAEKLITKDKLHIKDSKKLIKKYKEK